MTTLLQISWRMWQWKNFENRPAFNEVTCRQRRLTFFCSPCTAAAVAAQHAVACGRRHLVIRNELPPCPGPDSNTWLFLLSFDMMSELDPPDQVIVFSVVHGEFNDDIYVCRMVVGYQSVVVISRLGGRSCLTSGAWIQPSWVLFLFLICCFKFDFLVFCLTAVKRLKFWFCILNLLNSFAALIDC